MTQTCTTYPAVAAVPGVPAYVESVAIAAWDAGAIGGDDLDGDVSLKFNEMASVVGVVIGLTVDETVTTPGQMTHAFYFYTSEAGRTVAVMEGGQALAKFGAYTPETEFELRRIGTSVQCLIDNDLVYTSRKASAGIVHVGCALYGTGDAVPSNTTEAAPVPAPEDAYSFYIINGFVDAYSEDGQIYDADWKPLPGSAVGEDFMLTVEGFEEPMVFLYEDNEGSPRWAAPWDGAGFGVDGNAVMQQGSNTWNVTLVWGFD